MAALRISLADAGAEKLATAGSRSVGCSRFCKLHAGFALHELPAWMLERLRNCKNNIGGMELCTCRFGLPEILILAQRWSTIAKLQSQLSIQSHTIIFYNILYHTILYYTILYYTILYYTRLD